MKTRDGRLSYVAAGNPSLPPLVFLHGIGGAARAWHGQLDFFKDRYRTIAWDMPGYGGWAPPPTLSLVSLAGALPDFLPPVRSTEHLYAWHFIMRTDRPEIP